MNCEAARRSIVLGDEAGDSRAAAAHAAACDGCRAFAAATVPPLTTFRDELPLGDADLARIRAHVRAAVREPAPRPFFAPALGLTALAAIVIVLFGYFLWHRAAPEPEIRAIPTATFAHGVDTNDISKPDGSPAAATPSTTLAGVDVESPRPSPQQSPSTRALASPEDVPRVLRVAAHERPSDRSGSADSPTVAATAPAPLFIEIHTADPDVRILWIANQVHAESNPTSVMED